MEPDPISTNSNINSKDKDKEIINIKENNYQLHILYKPGFYCINPFKNKSEKIVDVPKASNVISSKNYIAVNYILNNVLLGISRRNCINIRKSIIKTCKNSRARRSIID